MAASDGDVLKDWELADVLVPVRCKISDDSVKLARSFAVEREASDQDSFIDGRSSRTNQRLHAEVEPDAQLIRDTLQGTAYDGRTIQQPLASALRVGRQTLAGTADIDVPRQCRIAVRIGAHKLAQDRLAINVDADAQPAILSHLFIKGNRRLVPVVHRPCPEVDT